MNRSRWPARIAMMVLITAAGVAFAAGSASAQAGGVKPVGDLQVGGSDSASAATAGSESNAAAPGSAAVTTDYVAKVRADYTPENRAYWTTNVVLDLVDLVYGVVIGLALLFLRISARIRDFAYARSNSR